VAYDARNNKAISYEITKENESTSDSDDVVIRSSLIIFKATKRILPYNPNFFSQFEGLLVQLLLTRLKLSQAGSCVHFSHALLPYLGSVCLQRQPK